MQDQLSTEPPISYLFCLAFNHITSVPPLRHLLVHRCMHSNPLNKGSNARQRREQPPAVGRRPVTRKPTTRSTRPSTLLVFLMASDFPSVPDAVDQATLGLSDLDCARAIFSNAAAPSAFDGKISRQNFSPPPYTLATAHHHLTPFATAHHHPTPSPQAPSASRPFTSPSASRARPAPSARTFSAGRASRAAFRVPTRARCAARARRRARPSSSRTRRRARCPSRPTSRRRSRRGCPRRRRRTRGAPRRRRRSRRARFRSSCTGRRT